VYSALVRSRGAQRCRVGEPSSCTLLISIASSCIRSLQYVSILRRLPLIGGWHTHSLRLFLGVVACPSSCMVHLVQSQKSRNRCESRPHVAYSPMPSKFFFEPHFSCQDVEVRAVRCVDAVRMRSVVLYNSGPVVCQVVRPMGSRKRRSRGSCCQMSCFWAGEIGEDMFAPSND
jgi:hypothetical protein